MEIQETRITDLKTQAGKLLTDALSILNKPEKTAEETAQAVKMKDEAMKIKADIDALIEIKAAGEAFAKIVTTPKKDDDAPAPNGFKNLGEFLCEAWLVQNRGKASRRLKTWIDSAEPSDGLTTGQGRYWEGQKDLVESIGASGGFLVPTEQSNQFLSWDMIGDHTIAESRATRIPMRRREIRIPALKQDGTTAGQPHWWGGVLAKWTEEGGLKEETQPTFREVGLVAHKLVCYTEASDELLEDSAVSLEALLTSMFRGVTMWERQNAFINGSGAGQPLGLLNAPATLTHQPFAANALAVSDFAGMLEKFQGSSPVWFMSRQWMSELIQLNGPTGNPSYVFISNARDSVSSTLFGYPLYFVEQMPAKGQDGSVLLADWSKYLVGDRQAITIDSSKHARFQYDITSWRCVSRVDGQPWLNAPFTWSDGSTQTSPFVKLGAIAGGS